MRNSRAIGSFECGGASGRVLVARVTRTEGPPHRPIKMTFCLRIPERSHFSMMTKRACLTMP